MFIFVNIVDQIKKHCVRHIYARCQYIRDILIVIKNTWLIDFCDIKLKKYVRKKKSFDILRSQ